MDGYYFNKKKLFINKIFSSKSIFFLRWKIVPQERIELSTFASLYCIYKYDALTDWATRACIIFFLFFEWWFKMARPLLFDKRNNFHDILSIHDEISCWLSQHQGLWTFFFNTRLVFYKIRKWIEYYIKKNIIYLLWILSSVNSTLRD